MKSLWRLLAMAAWLAPACALADDDPLAAVRAEFIANLAAGEYVQISAKRRVLDGGTDRVMFTAIYPWFTPEKVVALPPFLTVGQAVFTLTQLNGSSRDFPWSLETP